MRSDSKGTATGAIIVTQTSVECSKHFKDSSKWSRNLYVLFVVSFHMHIFAFLPQNIIAAPLIHTFIHASIPKPLWWVIISSNYISSTTNLTLLQVPISLLVFLRLCKTFKVSLIIYTFVKQRQKLIICWRRFPPHTSSYCRSAFRI